VLPRRNGLEPQRRTPASRVLQAVAVGAGLLPGLREHRGVRRLPLQPSLKFSQLRGEVGLTFVPESAYCFGVWDPKGPKNGGQPGQDNLAGGHSSALGVACWEWRCLRRHSVPA
jgi:hypothetical protein